MRQYLLINTIILLSFHNSGSCEIGLILVFGSKQKPHHIANVTIFPISKSTYAIKRKLENHFRNSKCIAFNSSTLFQVSCQNAIWKNGPTFANGTAAEFNIPKCPKCQSRRKLPSTGWTSYVLKILLWCLLSQKVSDQDLKTKKKRDRKKNPQIFEPWYFAIF